MLAELWRRAVVWAFEPDPDYEYDSSIPPDPPVEDPHAQVIRTASAMRAAQDAWVEAVVVEAAAARRVDR